MESVTGSFEVCVGPSKRKWMTKGCGIDTSHTGHGLKDESRPKNGQDKERGEDQRIRKVGKKKKRSEECERGQVFISMPWGRNRGETALAQSKRSVNRPNRLKKIKPGQ